MINYNVSMKLGMTWHELCPQNTARHTLFHSDLMTLLTLPHYLHIHHWVT